MKKRLVLKIILKFDLVLIKFLFEKLERFLRYGRMLVRSVELNLMSSVNNNMFHHHENYPECSFNLIKLEILVKKLETIKQSI